MALSERLAYILDFDVKSGIRSLEKVGTTAERELGKAERKLDKISTNLSKFGAGAVAAAGVAGVALFKMGQGAAESEANLSALNQVLGETIAQNLAKWAEDGAKSVGMSERAIYAAATSFGQLGKVAGLAGDELENFTKRQITLAADMAAFKDVSPEQAIQDLTAAYAGSSETLQKYNVFVNDTNIKAAILSATGEKVTGTLTSQQRVMGINLLLMEQTADISGQWGRESEGLAGQQAQLSANLQNLSDNIGRGVLPMLTKIVGVGADAAGALASMDQATGGAIGKFAALGTGGLALIGTLSLVAGQVIKMRDNFTTLDKDGTRSLNNVGKAAKGVGIALGVATVALAAYTAYQSKVEGDVREIADAFASTSAQTDEAAAKTVEQLVTLGKVTNDLKPATDLFVKGNIEAARRLVETGAAAAGGAEFVEMLTAAIKAEETARANAASVVEEYGDATEAATEATEDATKATGRSSDAIELQDQLIQDVNKTYADQQRELEKSERAQERAAEAAEAYQDSLDRQRQAIEDLNNANLAMLGGDIAVREASRRAREEMAEFTEVAKEAKVGTDEYQEAADGATSALLNQASAATEYEVKQREANGETVSAADKADIMEQALRDIAAMLGPGNPLFAGLQSYIDMLNNIPRNVSTVISTRGGGSISVGGGGGNVGGTGFRGTRHSGGPVEAGGLYDVSGQTELLHENGRTLLIAGSDGRVEAAKSGGSAGGSVAGGLIELGDETIRKLAAVMLAGASGAVANHDARLAAQLRQGVRG